MHVTSILIALISVFHMGFKVPAGLYLPRNYVVDADVSAQNSVFLGFGYMDTDVELWISPPACCLSDISVDTSNYSVIAGLTHKLKTHGNGKIDVVPEITWRNELIISKMASIWEGRQISFSSGFHMGFDIGVRFLPIPVNIRMDARLFDLTLYRVKMITYYPVNRDLDYQGVNLNLYPVSRASVDMWVYLPLTF